MTDRPRSPLLLRLSASRKQGYSTDRCRIVSGTRLRRVTEDLAHFRSGGEVQVPGIDLKLDSQVRIGSGQVHGVLEALQPNRRPEQRS